MNARYIAFTRPDGKAVWVNLYDPPRRIAPSGNHEAGNTIIIWGSDTQAVNESVDDVRQTFSNVMKGGS